MSQSSRLELAARVLRLEAEAVLSLVDRLDGGFERAVETILACSGRTVVTGIGKSGLVGRKIAATMASTGTPSLFLHPGEGIHGDLGMVGRGDVVVALSNSGETDEVIRIVPVLKRFEIALIAMVGNRESTLARMADVVLDCGVAEEACPLGLAPTSSTAATMAMGDALAVVLLTERGFRPEDFAVFHPGGSLGKSLLLRVEDVMHGKQDLPRVEPSAPMSEVVVSISSGRLGATAVISVDGDLEGIITDGDLRRGVEARGQELFSLKARDIMTSDPKVVKPGDLAAAALGIMERHSITSLLVLDGARPVGILHLHDLLKSGIA